MNDYSKDKAAMICKQHHNANPMRHLFTRKSMPISIVCNLCSSAKTHNHCNGRNRTETLTVSGSANVDLAVRTHIFRQRNLTTPKESTTISTWH